MTACFISHLSALSYILVPVFLCVLMLVWLIFRFIHSFDHFCHPRYLETVSVSVELFLSQNRNLSLSLFLLSSIVGSHASACNDFTGESMAPKFCNSYLDAILKSLNQDIALKLLKIFYKFRVFIKKTLNLWNFWAVLKPYPDLMMSF